MTTTAKHYVIERWTPGFADTASRRLEADDPELTSGEVDWSNRDDVIRTMSRIAARHPERYGPDGCCRLKVKAVSP